MPRTKKKEKKKKMFLCWMWYAGRSHEHRSARVWDQPEQQQLPCEKQGHVPWEHSELLQSTSSTTRSFLLCYTVKQSNSWSWDPRFLRSSLSFLSGILIRVSGSRLGVWHSGEVLTRPERNTIQAQDHTHWVPGRGGRGITSSRTSSLA